MKKILILCIVFCFNAAYSQKVVQIANNHILIEKSDNLKRGDEVQLFRLINQKEVKVGKIKITNIVNSNAWANSIFVTDNMEIKIGDYYKPTISESDNKKNKESPRVSNIFFETDLRQALRDLADEAQIPIIPDHTVDGFVTLEFENSPLNEVLNKLLTPIGYTYKQFDGYYLVGSTIPEAPSFLYLSETSVYHPNYIQAQQVPDLLSTVHRQYLHVNNLNNSITITAPQNITDRIIDSIEKIDVPPRQISIEAMVVEFSNDARRSLGIDWEWLGGNDNKQLYFSSNMNTNANDSSLVAQLLRTGINYKNMSYDVLYKLNALATSGKANIKANPKITTMNGQEASIFIGTEQYFSIISGPVNYPYARVERIPVGISLKITPRVSEFNEITVFIESEVSEVTSVGSSGLPLVTKRNAQTTVRVKNGEVIGIGGLVQESDMVIQKKIPFLGSIPVLGYLFSNTQTDKIKKEINILITPKIL